MGHNKKTPPTLTSYPKSKPIIAWMGGKRRLAKHILPLFPDHQCYVEPFAGGAALFFMKTPSDVEVLNDINGELINLYRIVRYHLDELIRQFHWSLVSREIFSWLKASPTETLTDIQRAARFYYLQKCAFGGKITGQTFGTAPSSPPKLNHQRMEKDLSVAHRRLLRTYIEHLDWQECIARYDRANTLFYLDPPYYGTAGYGNDFGLEQYDEMAALARLIKGKMIISVNDIPAMHTAFSGLEMQHLETTYTVGGTKHSQTRSGELLIRNFT
ncbi:MAG: DNA adenine methylase [Oxalobacter sp.]|nr:DNA adenine methylase [Oxalobacter sp.]